MKVSAALMLFFISPLSVAAVDAPSLQDWAQKHAVPLASVEPGHGDADLRPFMKIIGDARIVGFSEVAHLTHDWLAMRNRLFQYLVEHGGVTAYVGETEFLSGFAIDDYVMGSGALTSDMVKDVQAFNAVGYEENQQLIEWIRAYNARPTTRHRVRFYGMDVLRRPLGCKLEPNTKACFEEWQSGGRMMSYALTYLENSGIEDLARRALGLKKQLEPALKSFNFQGRDSIRVDAWNQLSAALNDTISVLDARRVQLSDATSPLAYARAYRAALTARRMDVELRSAGNATWGQDVRDREGSMVENLRWAVERENIGRGRVFLFMRAGQLALAEPARGGTATGAHVRRIFGQDFVSIGSISFVANPDDNRGIKSVGELATQTGTMAGVLNRVNLPIYLLDLRTLPAGTSAPLTFTGISDQVTVPKSQNSSWPAVHPANVHDAIVVIKEVTKAHVLKADGVSPAK